MVLMSSGLSQLRAWASRELTSILFRSRVYGPATESEGMPVYLSRAFFGALSRTYRKACLGTAVAGSRQGMSVHVDVVTCEVCDLGQGI